MAVNSGKTIDQLYKLDGPIEVCAESVGFICLCNSYCHIKFCKEFVDFIRIKAELELNRQVGRKNSKMGSRNNLYGH